MIRHLLRMAWHRRRANALVALEIAASFLVVALLADVAVQFAVDSRRPLGFRRDDVWVVRLGTNDAHVEWSESDAAALRAVLAEARAFDGVLAAGACSTVPYDQMENNWQFKVDGRPVDAEFNAVTDGVAAVFGLEIVQGRWFDESDEGAEPRRVVVDSELARIIRPDGAVAGLTLPPETDGSEMHVIGVVSEFREGGELSGPRPHFFTRKSLLATSGMRVENVVLRMRPGTPMSLEPALLARFRAAAPQWQFEMRTLEAMRAADLKSSLGPLAVGAVVAGFLLLMVVLGLTGVLWQNVTRRTREFALRRAVGATPGDVRLLVLGELAVVAGAAILAATALAAQVPLLGIVPELRASSHALGLAAAGAFVLGIVTLCGLYPGTIAVRASPAEALRTE
jgi:putative ABC transport system permease protein